MCPTPPPVYEFGQRIMNLLVNQQFDVVSAEIESFRENGYIVYYTAIFREGYESPQFTENARKIIQEAKETSNGWKYNGILVFFPSINKENYGALFNPTKPSIFMKAWDLLFWKWSTHFNEKSCLGNPIINQSEKACEDTTLYLMAFYFKGGLNWK